MSEKAVYTHGHHTSVISSHARRTAEDSAGFLLPHIKPTDKILDLGCGPGSITVGLATRVPQGSVIGGDAVGDILVQARELASSQGITNLTFEQMDGNALRFQDGEFDIVYCHQTLQHVKDPVNILKEMRRVTKKGGIVAARDADYKTFAWWPEDEGLTLWGDLYQKVAIANGGQPQAGRYLRHWAGLAGFSEEDITFTWNHWHYDQAAAQYWGEMWTQRSLHSNFATTGLKTGSATQEDLDKISKTWLDWSKIEGRFIIVPSGEILCRVR